MFKTTDVPDSKDTELFATCLSRIIMKILNFLTLLLTNKISLSLVNTDVSEVNFLHYLDLNNSPFQNTNISEYRGGVNIQYLLSFTNSSISRYFSEEMGVNLK